VKKYANDDAYFDVHDKDVDNSEDHMAKVTEQMSHESDF
jgi:hypothetical protein